MPATPDPTTHGIRITECPNCLRPADVPWRLMIRGRAVDGCSDTFHAGHVQNDPWHGSAVAAAIRDGSSFRPVILAEGGRHLDGTGLRTTEEGGR